jgi:hypothetical protein
MGSARPTDADHHFDDSRRRGRTLAFNGEEASVSGTGSRSGSMTPSASALRESTHPVLANMRGCWLADSPAGTRATAGKWRGCWLESSHS